MGKDIEYDLEALKKGLGKLDENIHVFEVALAKERATKDDWMRMIEVLEAKKNVQR